jgi:para-nitrobenzyl esterase
MGGARRFSPPVAPEPWTDVKDALAYGPASMQPGKGEDGETLSEDCLFLNVWTPAVLEKKGAGQERARRRRQPAGDGLYPRRRL